MTIAGSQYIIDFATEPAEDPWVDASWTDVNNTFEIAGGGLRANGFVQATAKYNTTATAAIIKSKLTIATNGTAASDPLGPAIIDDSTGALYVFQINGTGASAGTIRERTTGSGTPTGLGAAFNIATASSSDEFELWYETATGTLSAVQNNVVLTTRTDTTLQAATLKVGIYANPANNNGRRVGYFAADYSDAAPVTIDDTDADTRVTESRTVRITVPTTAPTTGNTSVYINADTNAAITPTSCTLVSGLTYDIVFTVPDEYAGLRYDSTGYPIIVETTDGQATSANVPYLPVTGNDFVNPTVSVPGDIVVLSGTFGTDDQLEYETAGGTISISTSCIITYTGGNPAGVSFDVRAWDNADDTWGGFATMSFGGDSVTDSVVEYGLINYGLAKYGVA